MLLRFIILLALVLGAIIGIPCGIFESYTWLWALPLMAVGFTVLFLLLVFVYVLILSKRVDQNVEQEDDDPHYRWVQELVVESVLPLLRVSVKTKGINQVPQGRFVLVCNHVHDLDPAPLFYALPGHQLAFIAKKEVRDMAIVGPMLHKLLGQFIDRENDREALKTILRCIQILKEDKASIAVFPEGGIHDDRKFHHFRPGVFKIAQKAKVPVVVCTLKNTRPLGHNITHLKPTTVEVSVLTVIWPEEFEGVTTTELADRVYHIMAEDLGPENVAQE
jgi:1-acyl-sn-glycerol-3-phosphate acyltransferase